jgi:hypothetical protein
VPEKPEQPTSSDSFSQSPANILKELNIFAPKLLGQLKAETSKVSSSDFDEKNEYNLLDTDVQRSDSAITPLVGVIRISQFISVRSKTMPAIGSFSTSTYTVKLAPISPGKWKLIMAQRKVEDDHPTPGDAPTTGEVSDRTEGFRSTVELAQK